ncbi:MAG: UvrD-helicase domain-containing protein, partial [Clostridia bacterium]|nr:UvrD-helicase domain-containing protein [Clostridia bacterium]
QGVHCCIDVGVCRYLGTATESLAPSLFMVTKILKLTAKKTQPSAKIQFIEVSTKVNEQNHISTSLVEMKNLLGKEIGCKFADNSRRKIKYMTMGNNIYILYGLYGAIITIIMAIFLMIYILYKNIYLRKLSYSAIYIFMKDYNIQDHYTRIKQDDEYLTLCRKLKNNQYCWFLNKKSKTIIQRIVNFNELASNLILKTSPLFHNNHYFAYSEYETLLNDISEIDKIIPYILDSNFKMFVIKKCKDTFFIIHFNRGYQHYIPILRNEHNKQFIADELKNNNEYFNTIMKYPLDVQQRKAIVTLEDNCLVISSAGSGKTSTAIGKVKYLIEKQHYEAKEICVLSYNSKTAAEFRERLDNPDVTVKTFHSLAMDIISQSTQRRPDICDDSLLMLCHYALAKKDENYKKAINDYITDISDATMYEHQYQKADNYNVWNIFPTFITKKSDETKSMQEKGASDYYSDRAKYGIIAPFLDMNGQPIYTKSIEEKKICTWLSKHDIKFQYEKKYPINTANTQHRQYKPDFTIWVKQNGQMYYLFLEHFGIDKYGNVPKWFGDGKNGGFLEANRKYNEDIQWKRKLHKKNHTVLLETTSAMFHDGTVFQKLEQQLIAAKVPMRLLSEEEIYDKVYTRNLTMEKCIKELFTSLITLMKSNGKTFETIMESIKKDKVDEAFCKRCEFLLYKIIKPLYDEYEKTLSTNEQVDYTDLILDATQLCNSGQWKSPFKYIIVDEFQDISMDRYKFILSLINKQPKTKTFCVGDDWQSIYRFSGSDLNLFKKFEQYFGKTERCKIETTYRFGNPLIYLSSSFILKNTNQTCKTVKAFSNIVNTTLSFIPFIKDDGPDTYFHKIEEVIKKIPKDETILLLARYNHDIKAFPKQCINNTNVTTDKKMSVTIANRIMPFMTVHAAKGLEADNVIIINCSQSGGGFPSRISDDPILGYVLCEVDTYEYSEERRLFYVAITRAKKHTYIFYDEQMPSLFVTELLSQNEKSELCPFCKKGYLKPIKKGTSSNGNTYINYRCDNSIAGCRFFKTDFLK